MIFIVLYLIPVIPFALASGLLTLKRPNDNTADVLIAIAALCAGIGLLFTYANLDYLPIMVSGDKENARQNFGMFGFGLLVSFWTYGLALLCTSSRQFNGFIRLFSLVILFGLPIILLQRLYLSIALLAGLLAILINNSRRSFAKLAGLTVAIFGFFMLIVYVRTDGNLSHLKTTNSEHPLKTLTYQISAYYASSAANTLHFLDSRSCLQHQTFGREALGPFYTFLFKHTTGWISVDDLNAALEWQKSLLVPIYNVPNRIIAYCRDAGGDWVLSLFFALLDGLIFAGLFVISAPALRFSNYVIWVALVMFYPMGFYHLTPNFMAGFLALNIIGWVLSGIKLSGVDNQPNKASE
jgi:hypothetical protein